MSVDAAVKARQSRVTKSGRNWEAYVAKHLISRLAGTGIEIIGGSESSIRKRGKRLHGQLALAQRGDTSPIWGDVDLVALKGEQAIAIISCKTSLHGRLTETLFYSVLFKNRKGLRVVLATCDAGSGSVGKLSSEWGTPTDPTKNRSLAEAFLDGVYVDNVPGFTPTNIKTVLGGKIKKLGVLPSDLKSWSKNLPH